ncbi:hypothetical protein BgAZ_301100 [Babesia gibsoni]|uniref:Uncharacterized protein n=1 Tax=Babesia gibsoni TaxID=33632 RepID=A0AAD8PDQ8_BABGI|nr:hypothetical protein BgAZ_301100 [Babesia gibsoni]
MEPSSDAKHCSKRIEALKYEIPRIARVFGKADDILEKQPNIFIENAGGVGHSFDHMRIALLENRIQRLKDARKLFKPIYDSSSLMLERVDSIASMVASARENLSSVVQTEATAEIERLRAHISLTEKRLLALNQLMDHLNPSINSIDYDCPSLDSQKTTCDSTNIMSVLETADNLIESMKFCETLNELEYLKGSTVLLEASQRITSNMDKVCEMLYLRLQRASRMLSKVLCKAFDEASDIALKHSNSFVPPMPPKARLSDDFGMSSILKANSNPESSLALRALKLLQMRPAYLYHFVNGMRDMLGQISLKHFSAYASSCTVDPYNRNEAVKRVLEHLYHNVTYIRGCVSGLYSNAGLPFHYSESSEHGAKLMKVSEYFGGIIELLVNPLEEKLNKVMAVDGAKVVDGIVICNGIVDMFIAMQVLYTYIEKMENLINTPWVHAGVNATLSITSEQEECVTDVEDEGDEASQDGAFTTHAQDTAIVVKLRSIFGEWSDRLFSSIEEGIGVPLADEPTCQVDAVAIIDISVPHIIHTICEFLEELMKIRPQYDMPIEMVRILETTVNPTINWCQKSAQHYGEHSSAYLINCFAKLQKALDNDTVSQPFKQLLQTEIDTHVEATTSDISKELKEHLGINGIKPRSDSAKEVMKKISAVVFGDGIMDCDIPTMKRLKLVVDSYQKVIKSRLYRILAGEYLTLSGDEKSMQVKQLIEFTEQL